MSLFDRMLRKVSAGRKRQHSTRPASSRRQPRRLTMEQMEQRVMFSAPQLTVTPYSTTEMALVWTTVPNAMQYVADYRTIGGAWQSTNVANNSDNLTFTGALNPNTTYQFQVGAQMTAGTKQGAGQASWSNIVTAETGTGLALPTAATAYSNFGTASYGGSLFGKNGPSYLDVQQGTAADCWLLASLAEVAARDPQDIQNMFSWAGTAVDQNGTVNLYTVRFYDSKGVAEYVGEDAELPAGGATYDLGGPGREGLRRGQLARLRHHHAAGQELLRRPQRRRPCLGAAGDHRKAGQRLRRQYGQPRQRLGQG
jgi:hypothetical protein